MKPTRKDFGNATDHAPLSQAEQYAALMHYFQHDILRSPLQAANEWQKISKFYFYPDHLLIILESIKNLVRDSSVPMKIKQVFKHPDAYMNWFDRAYDLQVSPRSYFLEKSIEFFAWLNTKPETRFLDMCFAGINLSFMYAYATTRLVDSLAHLSIVPPQDFTESMMQEFLLKKKQYGTHDIARLSESFAIFDHLEPNGLYAECTKIFLDALPETTLGDSTRRMISNAAHWFGLEEYKSRSNSPKPQNQSGLSDWVKEEFRKSAGLTDDNFDIFIPAVGENVDIILDTPQGQKIIVLVDHPINFLGDADTFSQDYNGKIKFLTALLAKLYPDYSILHVHHDDCRISMRAKIDLIDPLLRQLDETESGSYVSHYENGSFGLQPLSAFSRQLT